MPIQVQEFAFDPQGNRRIQIHCDNAKQTVTVLSDGSRVGIIADEEELLAGCDFLLKDGSILKVHQLRGQQLQVFRNGEPLRLLSSTAASASPAPVSPFSASSTAVPRGARGGCLTVWLILMVVAGLLLAFLEFSIYQDLEAHQDPTLPHWPFLLGALLALVGPVAAIALFFWRKWGFYLYLIGVCISILFSVFLLPLGAPLLDTLRGIVLTLAGVAILYRLLKSNDRWDYLR